MNQDVFNELVESMHQGAEALKQPRINQQQWEALVSDLERARSERMAAEASIKDVRRSFNDEMKPYTDKKKELEQHEKDLRAKLLPLAEENWEASGRRVQSFGGINLVRRDIAKVTNRIRAIQYLIEAEVDGKPIVEINESLLTKWMRETLEQIPVETRTTILSMFADSGFELGEKRWIALVGDSEES